MRRDFADDFGFVNPTVFKEVGSQLLGSERKNRGYWERGDNHFLLPYPCAITFFHYATQKLYKLCVNKKMRKTKRNQGNSRKIIIFERN